MNAKSFKSEIVIIQVIGFIWLIRGLIGLIIIKNIILDDFYVIYIDEKEF
jgi:hypothetical protein